MQHRGSRYFDGYQIEQTPEGKKLRYAAEWYGYAQPGRQRQVKAIASALILGMLGCYFAAQLHPSPGGMERYMAIPSLLSLVPMIFLGMGWVSFLLAKERWELRVYYAGFRRLCRSAACQLVLFLLWTAAEVYYLATHWDSAGAEAGYFTCTLICTAAMAALLVLLKRYPAQVVQGPEIK